MPRCAAAAGCFVRCRGPAQKCRPYTFRRHLRTPGGLGVLWLGGSGRGCGSSLRANGSDACPGPGLLSGSLSLLLQSAPALLGPLVNIYLFITAALEDTDAFILLLELALSPRCRWNPHRSSSLVRCRTPLSTESMQHNYEADVSALRH